MLFSVIDRRSVEKTNESELIVYFKNGSYLQLIGADNPDRLRGAGPMGIVLDEYDFMKKEVWDTLEPIIRQNNGWAWFVGTPKGKGKLYDLYNRGQDPRFAHEWKSYLLRASESGIITPQQLEESKLTMSIALFNQEWECDFIEGQGSVFRNVRQAAGAIPKPPQKGHLYVMGVDLAKVQDYTVMAIYDRADNHQVYQDRFQTLEWPFQKKRITEMARLYNNALTILDATGVGDPIADDLLRENVAVEPFKFTNESKKEAVEKLSIWIEQKKMAFINMEETLLEFDNYSYDITSSGRIIYNAREGYHDDIVMAHALAVWGLTPIIKEDRPEETPLIREELRRRISNTYGGSYDDSDLIAV